MSCKKKGLLQVLEAIFHQSACPSIDGALPSWPNDPNANEVWIGLHKDSFIYSHHSSFNSIIEDHYRLSPRQSEKIKKFNTISESLLCIPKNEISKLRSILEKSKGGSVLVTGYRGTGKSSMVNYCIQQIIEEHNEDNKRGSSKNKSDYVLIRINLSTARDPYALVMLMIKELYSSTTKNDYPHTIIKDIKRSYRRFVSELTIKESSIKERFFSFGVKDAPFLGSASTKNSKKNEYSEKLNPYTLHEAQLDLHNRLSDLRRNGFIIIFIFDEIDKLSPNPSLSADFKQLRDIQNIVSDLKFLLTESSAYNIFIAGKDADDSWQEDQHKGDGLFESVFVQNIYIPSTLKARLFPAVGPHQWVISSYNALQEINKNKIGNIGELKRVILDKDAPPDSQDKTFDFFLESLFRKMSETLGVEFGCCTYNTCLLILPYLSENELWKIILSISADGFDRTYREVIGLIKEERETRNIIILNDVKNLAQEFWKACQTNDEVIMLKTWVYFNIYGKALLAENDFRQENPITERRRRRIRFLMQYLTYKGHGIPRKILREMYSLVNHISVKKDKNDEYWQDRGKIEYIINIPSNLRKKIKFFANIVVILEQNKNFLRNLDDKGYVSIFYIIDYILKFFKTGFRWADIENANFMTQREEFYPGKTLASHLLDFLDQYLIESLDRRNQTYMLLPSIKRDLSSLFLLFGPEQIELRFTKTDISNELMKLNNSISDSHDQEASNRFESFKTQLRIARLYELMGNHLEARHQYSKALRWIRREVVKYIESNPSDQFKKASIITYISSAISALLRIGYLYELDREHKTSLHYYNSAIEFIYFACSQATSSILDPLCLPCKDKKDVSILPNDLIRKLYPYPDEHSLVTEDKDNLQDKDLIKNLLNKPLNTGFEPLGITDTLILTAINYEKLWKPYACNRFLLFTLQYLYKKGDIQAYIDHLVFMGGFAIRRRDIRLASTIYIHIANQLSEFCIQRSLTPPKVRMSIKAKLFECLGDIYYATDGATLIPDHDIKELKNCINDASIQCPGNRMGLCDVEEEDDSCIDKRLTKWSEIKKKAMEDIRKWRIIPICDNRDEELFYTQAKYFYALSNQPLKQCDILLKKSRIRLEMFSKSMNALNFKVRKKNTEDDFKIALRSIAIRSWCSFWIGMIKHLSILLGSDISKPTRYESTSLFFLDRKRYATALVLIGRMFMTIQRRNLTDFIFEHKNPEVTLSKDEIEKQISDIKKQCEASPKHAWRQDSPFSFLDMSNYYDLTKIRSLIEVILNILTDNTRRKDGNSIFDDKNGIIEHIGNKSLLWRLFYTKHVEIEPDSEPKYLTTAIKENAFLTGQLYLFHKSLSNKIDDSGINYERNLRCLYWSEISLLNAQLSLNDSIRDHYSANTGMYLGILYMDAMEMLFRLKQQLQKSFSEYDDANEFLVYLYSQLHIAAKRFFFNALDMMMVDKESERRLTPKRGEVYKHIGDLMIIRTEILYQIDNPGLENAMFDDWQVLKKYLKTQKSHSIDDDMDRTQIGAIKYYRKACSQYTSELESYNKQYPFPSNLYHFHNNIMDSKIHYEICSMIHNRYNRLTAYRVIDNNEQINKILSKMIFIESHPFEIITSGYREWLYDFKELFSLVNELSIRKNYIIGITGDKEKKQGWVCFINIEPSAQSTSYAHETSPENDSRHFFDPFKFCPLEV